MVQLFEIAALYRGQKTALRGLKNPLADMSTDPVFMKIGSEYYWYHNDHLGTPQMMTTSSGAVVWSAKYSSFGKAIVDPISTVVNPLRFPGQYEDVETGLHYNYQRYYCSEIGRYLRADPLSFNGGDNNLYVYVWNDSIGFIDPSGLGGGSRRNNTRGRRPGGRSRRGSNYRRAQESRDFGQVMLNQRYARLERDIRNIDPEFSGVFRDSDSSITREDVEYLEEVLHELRVEQRLQRQCPPRERDRGRITDWETALEQVEGIEPAQQRNRRAIENIDGSKQRLNHNLNRINESKEVNIRPPSGNSNE